MKTKLPSLMPICLARVQSFLSDLLVMIAQWVGVCGVFAIKATIYNLKFNRTLCKSGTRKSRAYNTIAIIPEGAKPTAFDDVVYCRRNKTGMECFTHKRGSHPLMFFAVETIKMPNTTSRPISQGYSSRIYLLVQLML
jgi:hypothetical protein